MIQEGNFLTSIITMPLKNLIIEKHEAKGKYTSEWCRKPLFPRGSHGQKDQNLLSLIHKKM